jgi:plasmid stability protein
MSKQISVRNVSKELAERLETVAAERGTSVNATVIRLLEEGVGIQGRREKLARYTTWTDQDLSEFEAALTAQRVVDEKLWR